MMPLKSLKIICIVLTMWVKTQFQYNLCLCIFVWLIIGFSQSCDVFYCRKNYVSSSNQRWNQIVTFVLEGLLHHLFFETILGCQQATFFFQFLVLGCYTKAIYLVLSLLCNLFNRAWSLGRVYSDYWLVTSMDWSDQCHFFVKRVFCLSCLTWVNCILRSPFFGFLIINCEGTLTVIPHLTLEKGPEIVYRLIERLFRILHFFFIHSL